MSLLQSHPYSCCDDAHRLLRFLAQGRPYESWVLNPSDLPADPQRAQAWEDQEGNLLGIAVVLSGKQHGSFLFFSVSPSLQGQLEPAVLAWAKTRACQLNPNVPTLLCRAEAGDVLRIRLLQEQGFERHVEEDQLYMEWLPGQDLLQASAAPLPPGYTLRPFTDGDVLAWSALWNMLWDRDLLPNERINWRTHPSYVSTLDLVVSAPDGSLAAICLGNLFRDEQGKVEDDGAWALWLGTASPHRQKGLARALLQAAMREFQSRGCRRVLLNVDADNTAAIRLYEALGFRAIYRTQGYVAKLSSSAVCAIL